MWQRSSGIINYMKTKVVFAKEDGLAPRPALFLGQKSSSAIEFALYPSPHLDLHIKFQRIRTILIEN
jgi:hypothetical protein